jgi:hypothetical protein
MSESIPGFSFSGGFSLGEHACNIESVSDLLGVNLNLQEFPNETVVGFSKPISLENIESIEFEKYDWKNIRPLDIEIEEKKFVVGLMTEIKDEISDEIKKKSNIIYHTSGPKNEDFTLSLSSRDKWLEVLDYLIGKNIHFEITKLSSSVNPQEDIIREKIMRENLVGSFEDEDSDLFRVILEKGYFNIPRKVTLKSLSNDLDIPPSTLNIKLRKLQEHLVRQLYESVLKK